MRPARLAPELADALSVVAQRLTALLPGDLTRVFFSESGSVAVEVALKMAAEYWINRGRPDAIHCSHCMLMLAGGVFLIERPCLMARRQAWSCTPRPTFPNYHRLIGRTGARIARLQEVSFRRKVRSAPCWPAPRLLSRHKSSSKNVPGPYSHDRARDRHDD